VGIKVGTALAAAHGKRGETVLENLFEAEKFENGKVNGSMKAEASLVRAKRAVELYPVGTVYADLSFVIYPGYPEHDDTFGFYNPFKYGILFQIRHLVYNGLEGFENLFDSLKEFRFRCVAGFYLAKNFLNVRVCHITTPL
jgi:hypothetical protein